MSVPAWSRLRDPFDVADLEWTVVEVADGGEEVRVTPRLRVGALHERLDRVLGIGGWSASYAALPGDAVACHLVIDGVTKGAVAAPARFGGGAATAAAAFTLAAERFGARPPWPADAETWVACDPSTLEPLHPPDPPAAALAAPAPRPHPAPAASLDAAAPIDAATPIGTGAESVDDAGGQLDDAGGQLDDAATPLGTAAAPPAEPGPAPAPKAEGQQIIDRLIDRLKAEGQGLAAARIMVRHGGYGKDPQAARELYGELRALLRAGAAERGADGTTAPGDAA